MSRPRITSERLALAQTTLGVMALAALLGAALWVLRPFIGPAIWAAMVVVATWGPMRRLQSALGGRRWLAATVMTLLLLLLFVVPLVVAIVTIVGHADQIIDTVRGLSTFRLSQPPPWLAGVPVVGAWLVDLWQQVLASGVDGLMERLGPYAGMLTKWFVAEVGGIGFLMVQFLLTVGLAAVMYVEGESWADTVLRIGERLGGDSGRHVVELAGAAIRGVALGVGVTALAQSLLGGVALAIAGVPFAGLLTAVMLMLCLAQVGPLPVLLAAVGWLFWQGETAWAVGLLAASAVVGTIDNVIRPALIRLGADLPLLLILAGVIGGLFAFGLVGIFVGPVVLAVGWTLLSAWIGDDEALGPAASGSDGESAVAAGGAVAPDAALDAASATAAAAAAAVTAPATAPAPGTVQAAPTPPAEPSRPPAG
jgi:predicted PurR-regulated permease PerM